jgi:hypothetical protein
MSAVSPIADQLGRNKIVREVPNATDARQQKISLFDQIAGDMTNYALIDGRRHQSRAFSPSHAALGD